MGSHPRIPDIVHLGREHLVPKPHEFPRLNPLDDIDSATLVEHLFIDEDPGVFFARKSPDNDAR